MDDDDYDDLNTYRWTLHSRGYAYRMVGPKAKRTPVFMHHQIMGKPEPPLTVDHRNRNKLDNRRVNLRVATKAAQQFNTTPRSKTPGISHRKYRTTESWVVRIGSTHVGSFRTIEEAKHARRSAELRLYGEEKCHA